MKIPKFLDDLSVISKLGDNPGADNGLTAEGLKAKFDEAGLKLQAFLNDTLIEKINSLFSLDAPPHEGMNMTGPINMNKNKLGGLADPTDGGDAVNLKFANENYRATMDYAQKVGNPYNLLDNSDFRNPVNQRGFVSGTVGAANYTIDRWKLEYDTYLHLHSGYVGISGFWSLTQLIGCKMFAGKTYTFSVEAKSEADNGTMFMRFGDPTGTGAKEHRQAVNSNGWSKCVKTWTADRDYEPGECDFSFGINTGNELTTQIYYKNPAVYEGEYTAETLPEYHPKGYGAELAECQRYFYAISGAEYVAAGYGLAEPYGFYPVVNAPVPMRTRPTVTYSGNWTIWDGSSEITIKSLAVNAGATANKNCAQLSLTIIGGANLTAGNMYCLTVRNDGQAYMWFSADL